MQNIQTHDHIIIGIGEVGNAIAAIFPLARLVDKAKDLEVSFEEKFSVMHVCIPYSDKFIKSIKYYQKHYEPKITIVHSTVPVGTCDEIKAVHSPIRGVHPNLEQGIRTFVKYFGGAQSIAASHLFAQQGIHVKTVAEARTTEALKLWDTTQYGLMIMIEKEIHEYCKQQGVDFETVYTDANQTYNDGYAQLGMAHVVRPHLFHMEGKIGGHCVTENAKLLASPLAAQLDAYNKLLQSAE